MPSGQASVAPKWSQAEVTFLVLPSTGTGPEALAVSASLERTAARWNDHAGDVGTPRFRFEPSSAPLRNAVRDGVSVVVLRTDRWCPGMARDEEEGCYDARRQAITHLYLNPTSSEIEEADLEVNGVNPAWLNSNGAVNEAALDALLVHELGHMLGLDHSCGVLNTERASAGERTQTCDSAVARASVMYPDPLEAGRALKLQPSPDALALLTKRYLGSADGIGATWGWILVATVILGLLCLGIMGLRRRTASFKAETH